MRLATICYLGLILACACSPDKPQKMLGMNGGVGGAGGSGGSLADAAIPETGGAGGAGGAGGMGGMGGSDVADAETPIEVPVEDSGPPAAGAFGAACQEASECDSALCLDEGVCSKPCTDTSECGNGWACSLVTGLGDYCDLTCEHADVLFVVDGSGSMCETFGDTTRWQAVRNALIDPVSGVIPARAGSTAFGLLVFEGTIDPLLATSPPVDAPPGPACSGMYTEQSFEGECPGLVEVPVALNNVVPIDAAYPATELGGSTPTDKAMNVAVDRMLARAAVEPAREQFIVLLTDGRPNDICVGGAGGDGLAQHQALAAAVDRGADAGITTFVINLGAGDTVLETRLDEIAVRGQKDNLASAPTPLYEESLVEVLSTTMSQVGCGGD